MVAPTDAGQRLHWACWAVTRKVRAPTRDAPRSVTAVSLRVPEALAAFAIQRSFWRHVLLHRHSQTAELGDGPARLCCTHWEWLDSSGLHLCAGNACLFTLLSAIVLSPLKKTGGSFAEAEAFENAISVALSGGKIALLLLLFFPSVNRHHQFMEMGLSKPSVGSIDQW